MFCKKCGAEIPEGTKFCTNCGSPVTEEAQQDAVNTTKERSPQNQAPKKAAPKVSKKAVTVIGAAAVVIVLLVLVIGKLRNIGPTIDLNNYVTVQADGYNGYGTAIIYIDWDAITEKYGEKIKYTSAAKKEYGDALNFLTPSYLLTECATPVLQTDKELSNGDEISYTISVDEDTLSYLNCKVKYEDGTQKIAGLTEVGTFDAFDGLTVEFTGIAPNGTANINYIGSNMKNSDFTCDHTSGLKNGDVVTVSINGDRMEYFAKNLGMVPEALQKEFTVEGLESYVSKLSEIDEDSLNLMKQQAEDVYNANVARNWNAETESLDSFEYLGDYLLTQKSSDSWSSKNQIILVYKATVHNVKTSGDDTYDKVNELYWYIQYSDLMVDADGNVNVDLNKYSIAPNILYINPWPESYFSYKWHYNAYSTLDELYKAAVTSNIDTYNHEDNVNVD